jgi:ComF family protein
MVHGRGVERAGRGHIDRGHRGQYIEPMPAPDALASLRHLPLRGLRRVFRGDGLPSLCAVCGAFGTQRVCGDCAALFAPPTRRCTRCALRVPPGASQCGGCLRTPPAQSHAVAAVDYAAPWDGLVTRFKFHAALDLAAPLAARLAQAVAGAGQPPVDLVVPAPLAPGRLAERGFNQAWELARRVARRRGCPADPHTLLRIRATAHQLDLPVEARAANVRDAFLVDPLRRGCVRGRCVAVVDDVLTTGATLDAMARALRDAGAADVHAWVFARTPAPGAA